MKVPLSLSVSPLLTELAEVCDRQDQTAASPDDPGVDPGLLDVGEDQGHHQAREQAATALQSSSVPPHQIVTDKGLTLWTWRG